MEVFIQVITTVETREDAERIAKAMVESRLAACAQVAGPITSTYWWKGRIEDATEWQCLLKTRGGPVRGAGTGHPEDSSLRSPGRIISMPLAQVSHATASGSGRNSQLRNRSDFFAS